MGSSLNSGPFRVLFERVPYYIFGIQEGTLIDRTTRVSHSAGNLKPCSAITKVRENPAVFQRDTGLLGTRFTEEDRRVSVGV